MKRGMTVVLLSVRLTPYLVQLLIISNSMVDARSREVGAIILPLKTYWRIRSLHVYLRAPLLIRAALGYVDASNNCNVCSIAK
jgi:hypothetical protein